jgi:regulatory protein YycH of two-component signal transduction system YycFG
MIKRIKAISLIFLVISSIILTVVLWYSAPPYDEQTNNYIPASYIGEDNYVPKKELYQLTAPPFLISHQQGKHHLITSQQSSLYATLIKDLYEVKLDGFEAITPTADDWKQLFFQTNGIEFSFLQDISVEQLDAFYYHLLENEALFQTIDTISRVYIFTNPKTHQEETWFISDQNGKVIRANAKFAGNTWSKLVQLIKRSTKQSPTWEVIPTNEKNPWERANQNIPFSRVLYLPTQPMDTAMYTYDNLSISIDHMKGWLFQGDEIEPIELTKNESVYMDNNQILTFYKQQSYMVYVDNTRTDETKTTVSNEIDMINSKFMSKHHGWTGNFLLDSMLKQENSRLYTFRLINQGLPVYWQQKTNKVNYLDTIQLQAGTGINAISKYIRALNYLARNPKHETTVQLPNKETVLKTLSSQNIALSTVTRMIPIYMAIPLSKGEIQLAPCWRVEQNNGGVVLIGGDK